MSKRPEPLRLPWASPVLDAIVVGGGFYGANIAHYLKTVRGFEKVLLLERGADLLTRSSFANQARVHGGYHYPRSFKTAYRSRINLPRFSQDFGDAVFDRFTSVYALARRNSKVTPQQMERFCAEIGALLDPAPPEIAALFNPQLVERAYLTVESAFNADRLRDIMWGRLAKAGVEVRLNAEVEAVVDHHDTVSVSGRRGGEGFSHQAALVFNCTYSRLQRVANGSRPPDFRLRHEVTEIVLVEPPEQLRDLGVTLMDGPFFSVMPFPARGLHSLSHVRYTPHTSWSENGDVDPYARLAGYPLDSGVDWMIRDSARYLPCLDRCRPRSTLFEVKTVLIKSEGDDSRPILYERHGAGGRVFSVLGGKIDNIYDILQHMNDEVLPAAKEAA